MNDVVLNGRYRVEHRLWTGDWTQSFLAYDAVLHRPVAARMPVRELAGDPAVLFDLQSRFRLASVLHHRNIIATLEVGEDHGFPYAIEEYVAGETLRGIIDDEGPFVIDDVAILIEQLAAGLDYAHQREIVHGALRPDVISVDASGMVRITGFGQQRGTPLPGSMKHSINRSDYNPVERFATNRSDLRNLAAIAYEMLTGTTPAQTLGDAALGEGHLGMPLHPNDIDSRIPVQSGDVVMSGLMMADAARVGMSSLEFANRLTDWRSHRIAAPDQMATGTRPPASASLDRTELPLSAWPVPADSPLTLEPPPPNTTRRSPGIWLTPALLILLAVAVVLLHSIGTSNGDLFPIDIPTELQALIDAR